MKDRVKLNTKTGKCYPQRKIFGLWFNYYVNGNIFTGDTYYCYSTESGLRYIELQKQYKEDNEISYHYLDPVNGIKYKNYRIVYVKKNGNIKLIAQRKYLFFWFIIDGNLRNFENGWNLIQNKHNIQNTPKIQYFYPERTRKERIKALK